MRTIRTKNCHSLIPGGRASDGCTLQFAIPAVNDTSSRAISPVWVFPRIPSNTTCLKPNKAIKRNKYIQFPDQLRFLGNCPPTPPLRHDFALVER